MTIAGDSQRERWDRALAERADRYGTEPSAPALASIPRLREAGVRKMLELGAGQGRDTLFFAQQGLEVQALDYASSGLEAIDAKARQAKLADRVTVLQHDVRDPLPYADGSFDACYSHMLFCMALTDAELAALAREILRVLRHGGLCIYTARTTDDPDFAQGVHHGDARYEAGGFVVHFFSPETVERLARGYEIAEVERFQEGTLPRDLFRVTLRKP